MQIIGLILLGLAAGVFSGLIGIGGGIIIIPALIYFFGFSTHTAQGTTLAIMVPPIGILAAWAYYQKGYVDLPAAALVAAGFVVGGLVGAKAGIALPADVIRKVFAVVMMGIAIKMLLQKA